MSLKEDVEALVAMHMARMAPGSIAATLKRSPAWVERQLRLIADREAAHEAEKARQAAARHERAEALRDMAAKGREAMAAQRRAEAVEPSSKRAARGDGLVERSFHVWPAGFGAAVRLGERLFFVETHALRLNPGDLVKAFAEEKGLAA